MKLVLIFLSFLMISSSFASECRVSFEQRNGTTSLSDQSLLNLREGFEFALALRPGIVIVPRDQADYHVVTRLLNWTDHHNQNLHNAFVSLSLYKGKEEKMFSYSHHFGRNKFKLHNAYGERNFSRANRSALQALKNCDNLRRLARE